MKNLYIFLIIFSAIVQFSCSDKGKNNATTSESSATESPASEANPQSDNNTASDTLSSGKGTQSMTPEDPGSGTSTSENGLSTDVGGIPEGQVDSAQ